jgi:hypothetical protein
MTFDENNQNFDNMSMNNTCCLGNMNSSSCCMQPVYECPEEKVCHRYICYDVPHIKPCNTRIINHHIYRHTFEPCYTSCEENVVENIYGPRCC